jgi:hypothetical protein
LSGKLRKRVDLPQFNINKFRAVRNATHAPATIRYNRGVSAETDGEERPGSYPQRHHGTVLSSRDADRAAAQRREFARRRR